MPISEARTPDERIEFLRGWSPEASEAFRGFAADYGYDLDYSPESLELVEELISKHFSNRRGKVGKKWHDFAGSTGAYLTEVILRNIGGEWTWIEEFDVAGLRLPNGSFVVPLAKSRKRYEDGPGDDFVSYYRVLASVTQQSD